MNETGATVLLRGRDSGSSKNELTEGCYCHTLCWLLVVLCAMNYKHFSACSLLADAQQPLHLLLSSNDPKSLEHAKLLAENLLDTISGECGASR